ncbi:DNA repair protein [Streptococcus caprae]|uniref:DNA repair protein n=1 Tax=Streptococcus caprae TaxID=1640501 RepID=A0ABV8CV48_9STRE
MEQVNLRKLKREQLLELMLQQQETIEMQEQKIRTLEANLNQREIKIEEAGSIAQAALALNGVFEAAQQAADQYLLSVKAIAEDKS